MARLNCMAVHNLAKDLEKLKMVKYTFVKKHVNMWHGCDIKKIRVISGMGNLIHMVL